MNYMLENNIPIQIFLKNWQKHFYCARISELTPKLNPSQNNIKIVILLSLGSNKFVVTY